MNKHTFTAPVMLALSLVFSATAMAQTASEPDCGCPAHRTTPAEWDAIMKQRLAMIDALEVKRDDAALAALLKEDKNLENYRALLRRTSGYLHDPRLLEKLLDFPALDKTSPQYIKAVGNSFAEFVANDPSPEEAKLASMMFERIKNDKAALDDALHFILETSAMFTGDRSPDVELTQLLVKNGADLNAAVASVRQEIVSNAHPLLQDHLDERLARLEKFRMAVTAPANPQPLPQTFAPKR
ncbi:MAG TPA: hypothetical protein VL625_12690 [Patescibacteria group bacterium]|nr:hypothetical protein [Patescibacteria group bacterium]